MGPCKNLVDYIRMKWLYHSQECHTLPWVMTAARIFTQECDILSQPTHKTVTNCHNIHIRVSTLSQHSHKTDTLSQHSCTSVHIVTTFTQECDKLSQHLHKCVTHCHNIHTKVWHIVKTFAQKWHCHNINTSVTLSQHSHKSVTCHNIHKSVTHSHNIHTSVWHIVTTFTYLSQQSQECDTLSQHSHKSVTLSQHSHKSVTHCPNICTKAWHCHNINTGVSHCHNIVKTLTQQCDTWPQHTLSAHSHTRKFSDVWLCPKLEWLKTFQVKVHSHKIYNSTAWYPQHKKSQGPAHCNHTPLWWTL